MNKYSLGFFAMGSIALLGVTTVSAATVQPHQLNRPAMGSPVHRGMPWSGAQGQPKNLDALAGLLKMTSADLQTALKGGKKIADIAQEHGVTQEQLNAFMHQQKQTMLDSMKQRLTQDVKDGKLTQAQMDQRLGKMSAAPQKAPHNEQSHMPGLHSNPNNTALKKGAIHLHGKSWPKPIKNIPNKGTAK